MPPKVASIAATSKMADAGTFGLTCWNAEAILVANDANQMAKAGQPSDGSRLCKTWLAELPKLSPMPKDGK